MLLQSERKQHSEHVVHMERVLHMMHSSERCTLSAWYTQFVRVVLHIMHHHMVHHVMHNVHSVRAERVLHSERAVTRMVHSERGCTWRT